MSNKVVPQTYRSIIDKVINSVRPDFEENGVEDAVLVALQQSWEAKLAMSRVTDFSSDPRLGAYQRMLPPDEPKGTLAGTSDAAGSASGSASANGGSGQVDEDVKPSEAVANAASASTSNSTSANSGDATASTSAAPAASTSQPPAPSKPAPNPDSNEIGSDLDDDSDEDLLSDEDDPTGENGGMNGLGGGSSDERGDVIIALYEKVQRVKNKWKITLKDGVISAEGKDYLFNKCQGDFEW